MGDEVNLQKFTDIVDLFFYLPMQKPIMSNDSTNLYYIMSSNVHGQPTHEKSDAGGLLHRMMDLLWIKIQEKFNTIHEAYRYFDVNFNNRVSFNEF